jgi:hypothetical protein
LLESSHSMVAQQFGDEQTWRWTFSPVLAHLETAGCANELGGFDIGSTFFKLLEGALTGNDFFDCARDSINSPMAAWVISFVFVMLTTVLLLNMLIAMCAAATYVPPCPANCPHLTRLIHGALYNPSISCPHRMAHTFDDVSKSSATNYLFFFAQRALAHHNEPPTPPPLNALGLPCNAMFRLWAWLYPEHAARHKHLSVYLKSVKVIGIGKRLAAAKEKAAKEKTAKEKAAMELKGTSSHGTSPPARGAFLLSDSLTAPEKIQPLADKIKEYILDHLDDGEQEVVKRDMVTSFREQRDASEKSFREQREESEKSFRVQREEMKRDMDTSFREQREASEKSFRVQREEILQTVNEEMQTVQAGMQKVQEEGLQSMQQRFDDVHLKLDETILLVRVLALESGHS